MILTPDVFGSKHLFGFIFMFFLVFGLLAFFIKRKHNQQHVLIFSAVLIISLETIKYIYMINEKSFGLNDLPFQLCSVSLYVMPLIAIGHQKINRIVMPIAFSIGLLAGSIALLYPSNILGISDHWFPFRGDLLPFVSFLYHAHMIFYALYLVTQKLYIPKLKDVYLVFSFLIGFALLANILNFIWSTDFMMLRYGNGNPFQFLISYHYLIFIAAMMVLGFILLILTFIGFTAKNQTKTQ